MYICVLFDFSYRTVTCFRIRLIGNIQTFINVYNQIGLYPFFAQVFNESLKFSVFVLEQLLNKIRKPLSALIFVHSIRNIQLLPLIVWSTPFYKKIQALNETYISEIGMRKVGCVVSDLFLLPMENFLFRTAQ